MPPPRYLRDALHVAGLEARPQASCPALQSEPIPTHRPDSRTPRNCAVKLGLSLVLSQGAVGTVKSARPLGNPARYGP